MTLTAKHKFISPIFEGQYRVEGSCGTYYPNVKDDFPKWLEQNRLAETGDSRSLLFQDNSLCAVLSEADIPSRDFANGEIYSYNRLVDVTISPPNGEFPVDLQEALEKRGYLVKKD